MMLQVVKNLGEKQTKSDNYSNKLLQTKIRPKEKLNCEFAPFPAVTSKAMKCTFKV